MRLALIFTILATPALADCPPAWQNWTKTSEPVFRDPIATENYQVASDGHVITRPDGTLAMIFTGDDSEYASIKLSLGSSWTDWAKPSVLLGPSKGHATPLSKETPFYLHAPNGEHQIYFIGYEDGETYESSVLVARSANFTGPYTIDANPVAARGPIGDYFAAVMTSPSVVEHDGALHLSYLAWNGFEDVTEVRVYGATSTDSGETWKNVGQVDSPIGMEGQVTPRPGGGFVAVYTGDYDGDEALYMACADAPFGPWEHLRDPIVEKTLPQHETDEIIAPQVTFDPETDAPHLYYTGADHARGWWMMHAALAKAN